MRKILTTTFFIVLILVFIVGGIFAAYKDNVTCDKHVVLEDTEFDAIHVYYYDSGIVRIKKCDGTTIEVPIRRIKEVKDL
jgi:hypothetical protein